MLKTHAGTVLLAALLMARTAHGAESLPAFPGAEGFGAVSKGGRGGRVIKVTNLNADGPGSLAAACAAKGPRIVVFEVSGVIPVKGRGGLRIEDSNITIAGQTAPGAGITIEGQLSTMGIWGKLRQLSNRWKDYDVISDKRGHDMTIRFLRLRPKHPRSEHFMVIAGIERFIVDHCSGSWGNDENMDFGVSRQFTIQWCANEESSWQKRGSLDDYRIGKSQQFKCTGTSPHNFAMIMGYTDKGNVSVHHNLFAHHNRRTPLCGLEILDHRNNVIYNTAAGVMFHGGRKNLDRPGKPFRSNVIGNYFKAGPSAPADRKDALPENKAGYYRRSLVCEAGSEMYAEGNHFATVGKTLDVWTAKLWEISMKKCIKAEKPWPAPPVKTHKAEEAYELVLAHAGCLPRDVVSRRTIKDVREGTGEWGRHDPEEGLMAGLKPAKAPKDSDNDGMPDEWETAHKLDPNDPKDGNKVVPAGASKDDRHKGYTYIEFYINELADKLIARAIADAKPETAEKK